MNNIPYIEDKPKELKDLTWQIIIDAWGCGASDRGVSLRLKSNPEADQLKASEVHAIYKDNAELADLKETLRETNSMGSKEVVTDAIANGNLKAAIWWLEHATDEFKSKNAVAFENGVISVSIEDKERALEQMIEDFKSGK